MFNIKVTLAYEGTHYLGWQKTKMGPSIEDTLERALKQILQEEISLQAASRTDAGVHAEEQVVNFFSKKPSLDLFKLKRGLNSLLPKDISILDLTLAHPDFHPTLDAVGKEYHYHLCLGPVQLPFFRAFSWHYPASLCLKTMQNAIQPLLGLHDFSSFCNARKVLSENRTCELFNINIFPLLGNRMRFSLSGNHFLYKMVRNIVGTLVYAGCGKLSLEKLPEILKGKDRTKVGMTAPALGLSLKQVFYEEAPHDFAQR